MERRVILLMIFIILFALVMVINFPKGKKEMKVEIHIFPETFSIQENTSENITVSVMVNGMPYLTRINWILNSTGGTGEILMMDNATTNERGEMMAVYLAPSDVDEMEHHVDIMAEVKIDGISYRAICHAIIYPLIHKTKMDLKCNDRSMIAGETVFLHARVYMEKETWIPFTNRTIEWEFRVGNTTIYKNTKTDGTGMTKIPFFYSNAEENITAMIIAKLERNLSGDFDYDSCNSSIYINITPEKPGDFPVVLIHGWIGSTSDALINYTWYNLTQKLVSAGYKVLDFDTTKPGIQWLTYKPTWLGEHHISWIAARVCEKIQEALILNGYPPNQTIDIVAHSMGGLVARFMAEHYMADVDYWNRDWNGTGYPWYGDGDPDITIGAYQIDDLIAVGTPCHGVPPNINESFLKDIIKYAYFPWWIGQVPDMVYHSPFLEAMGYNGTDLVDYYGVGGDIGVMMGGKPVDFNGDGIPHYSDGLVPAESPYLKGKPLYILVGKAWPAGEEDHISLIAINEKVHDYILQHLID